MPEKGTKVVYTAQGFHFFNGASKKLVTFMIENFSPDFQMQSLR